jgi:cytochrome c
VRKALILLAVVALLILVVGALNNGTAFDVDYVAGTVTSVSLLWVSAVLAALVFVVGLAAAWFAQAAMTGSRRKLEAELQATYERLREAEALAARLAPAPEAPVAEVVAATVVAEPEPATIVETVEVTEVPGEAVTVVDGGEAAAAAADETPAAGDAADQPAAEQTAITMAGTPADEAPAEPEAGESAEAVPEDGADRPETTS